METSATKKSILILDKDNRILPAVDDIMHNGNYDVHILFDPNSVFDKAKSLKPDLVILDYLLLNDDCAEICRDFKDDQEMQSVPLIVVTTYKTKKTRDEAYRCDALFVKPLDVSLFATSMNYLIAS